MTHQWNLTGNYDPELDREVKSVTITARGRAAKTIREDHPNFKQIVRGLVEDDIETDALYELFDVQKRVVDELQRLSERITYRNQKVYFDGDEAHSKLAEQVKALVIKGLDVTPVVSFWEKVAANPSENSKEQLFTFIDNHQITIFPDGDFVGYKGCNRKGDILYSTRAGHAIVDGVDVNGYIPNVVGSVIEMPRSEVMDDPHSECNAGLHIGTFAFASDYARHGSMLIVKVNPRDVVSVPHASTGQKLRVCRYTVIDEDIRKALQETIVGEDAENLRQIEEVVDDLKAVYAKKVAEDDGIIKKGSYVRTTVWDGQSAVVHEGTVVATEDYHGDLKIQRLDGTIFVAERDDLEIVPIQVIDDCDLIDISITKNPLPGHEINPEDLDNAIADAYESAMNETPEEYADGVERYDVRAAHLEKVLADAIAKAKKAKKTAVLIREMKNAGYEPKRGIAPRASTTSATDWQRIPDESRVQNAPELPENSGHRNPTEEEFANLIQEAKRRKKGLVAYARSKGWLFVTGSIQRGPEEAKVRTNWVRKED